MRYIYELIGIIKGISSDGIINDKEKTYMKAWADKNRNLAYDSKQLELIKQVDAILENGAIDENGRLSLLSASEKYLREMGDDSAHIYELHGLIEGIVCDNVVNDVEILHLRSWLEKNENDVKETESGMRLCTALHKVLLDGVVTKEEQAFLLDILSDNIIRSKFETKLAYLCKQVKAKKNIGLDLIDMLDNSFAMAEIHGRAITKLDQLLKSYTTTCFSNTEVIFVSLCLIGMLEYDGGFYDSVRRVYSRLYKDYPAVKIETLIREILDKYRNDEERNIRGVKNSIINVVLRNAIVPGNYLGTFFEFIYDIYKLNFEYELPLPENIKEEFEFIYNGLKTNLKSDVDDIQDNVTKKTYKLIKSTKQLIVGKNEENDAIIKLSIIVARLIDKQVWNKDFKIYNPYLKKGFDEWLSTLKNKNVDNERVIHSEIKSRWEPKFQLNGNDIYLIPPIHKINSTYNAWEVYVQVMSDGKEIYRSEKPDIREMVAGYKICPDKIKIENPLKKISYRLMAGKNVIYDSKGKLFRKFIVFNDKGTEISNNTDYQGTAIFCYKQNVAKLQEYYHTLAYKLASKTVHIGDAYFIEEETFNFSALIKPGLFGDDYDNVYVIKDNSSEKIKVYNKIRCIVFECDERCKNFEILINNKLFKGSNYLSVISKREGINKYKLEFPALESGIYEVSVKQLFNDKKSTLANFSFALDPAYTLEYEKLNDISFVYILTTSYVNEGIEGLIDLNTFTKENICFEYNNQKYFYLIPFELEAYRINSTGWKPLSEDIWVGDIANDTVLDVYTPEADTAMILSSADGTVIDNLKLKDMGTYKEFPIGFLSSYKDKCDYITICFINNQKVKSYVICNNKCQIRDETDIIYDQLREKLIINPWFWGKGNVCCEIFDDKDQSVFKLENLVNDQIIEVSDLFAFIKYTIVFSEKTKGLSLGNKKYREIKRFNSIFYSLDDSLGKEFEISEITYEISEGYTQDCYLMGSYIRFLQKRLDGKYDAEMYMRVNNSPLRMNLIKPVVAEICGNVVNGFIDIVIYKNGKLLSFDEKRSRVIDTHSKIRLDVKTYTIALK